LLKAEPLPRRIRVVSRLHAECGDSAERVGRENGLVKRDGRLEEAAFEDICWWKPVCTGNKRTYGNLQCDLTDHTHH
jgi:hypothetical protein